MSCRVNDVAILFGDCRIPRREKGSVLRQQPMLDGKAGEPLKTATKQNAMPLGGRVKARGAPRYDPMPA